MAQRSVTRGNDFSFRPRARRVDAAPVQATIVLFAVFAATVGNATVFATLGLFGRGVGLSEFEVGAIFASSGFLFFLTSSHWGRLSDRLGRTPMMAAGLAATAASLFLFAGLYVAGGTFLALLLARTIYGVLAGGIQPAAIAWMAGHTPPGRRASGVALVGASGRHRQRRRTGPCGRSHRVRPVPRRGRRRCARCIGRRRGPPRAP